MKSFLIAAILLISLTAWGQSPAPKDPAKAHEHAATAAAPEHDMHAMMTKCMESMAKALPTAEQTLADMKTALAKMKDSDPAAKHLAELNVKMWEAEVGHMKEMAAMHDGMKDKMKSMGDMKDMKDKPKGEMK